MSATHALKAALDLASTGQDGIRIPANTLTDAAVEYFTHRAERKLVDEQAFIKLIEARWQVSMVWERSTWKVVPAPADTRELPAPTIAVIGVDGKTERRFIDSIDRDTGEVNPVLSENERLFRTVDGQIHILAGVD